MGRLRWVVFDTAQLRRWLAVQLLTKLYLLLAVAFLADTRGMGLLFHKSLFSPIIDLIHFDDYHFDTESFSKPISL